VELLDWVDDDLRLIGDLAQEPIGQLEPFRRITDCLESPHRGRCQVTRQDVDLVFGIDTTKIRQQPDFSS
jgi:hypothetical protein